MKENELIVFGHNDLDQWGTVLNIEFKMPNIKKKYFYTNYINIAKKVDDIIAYQKEHGNKHLLMTDVSFSTSPEQLKRLCDLGINITLIDHHLYPDEFFKDYPNIKLHHSVKKCATLLCNEYFGNTGKNANLDKLSKLIDVYDLWQVKHPAFDISQDLNDYFWANDFEKLRDDIINNNYKLPDDFITVTNNNKKNRETSIKNYYDNKMIHQFGDITLAFVSEYFNHILIDEMRNGQNFVLGINPNGVIKVRINADAPYTNEQKNQIRLELSGTANIGHMHAFPYKYSGDKSFDNLMKEAEHAVNVISKICAK